jgi:hypothetical protein
MLERRSGERPAMQIVRRLRDDEQSACSYGIAQGVYLAIIEYSLNLDFIQHPNRVETPAES